MKIEVGRGGYERLRIWTPPDAPIADPALPSRLDACVEWRGKRPGHPSTYRLLGGTLRSGVAFEPLPGGPFEASLVGRGDDVTLGLTDRRARVAIETAAPDLTVTIAAEGAFGSSPVIFFMLAGAVVSLIRDGVPDSEERIWAVLDDAGRRAGAWAEDERARRNA